jgi:hypothetical protein
MKIAELKRELKKKGCEFHHHGANHDMWINTKNGNMFPIGRHDTEDVSKRLYNRILTEAGLK